ncbi:MAG: hypothetical protein WDZ83_15170 [Rhizobiaceae bacterium]
MNDDNRSTANACCSACDQAEETRHAAPAIACSLDAGDFRERTATINNLANRSLRSASRDGLTLRLTYENDALDEVRALAAKEAECCAFLDFTVTHDHGGVHVTIIAPKAASEAADELFAHFAPHIAGPSA